MMSRKFFLGSKFFSFDGVELFDILNDLYVKKQ